MKVVSDEDVKSVEVVDGVHLTQMAAGEKASMQNFYLEPGAEVPEHSHHHEQIGVVTQGTMTFVIDGTEETVHEGDTFVIPGDEPHGAYNDRKVPVEGYEIFAPPRLNPPWESDEDDEAE